jgi:lysophospholipase L1-like esterase
MPGSTLNMLVLGDSVAWGQGLQPEQKFHSLVKAAIEARTPGVTVVPILRAHSGAVICTQNEIPTDPQCTATDPPVCGEVPTRRPSIVRQCDEFTGPATDAEIDLILVTGGSNDVDLFNILNPMVSTATLEPRIVRFCGDALRELLGKLCKKFGHARIIVVGYYPIISNDSGLTLPNNVALQQLAQALVALLGPAVWAGMSGGGLLLEEVARQNIIVNCQYFADRSSQVGYWAVFDQRTALGRLIDYVDVYTVGFDGTRSVLTANSWLFGINGNDGTRQDTVDRQAVCNTAWGSAPDKLFTCQMASVGHPNPQGARAYADAILNTLFPHLLTVRVSPSPIPFGEPTSVIISAEDVSTHAPVAGTVKIRNFDALGRPVYARFPTGTAYAATFREGTIRVFDPELRKWIPEPGTYPSGVVSAAGYPSTEVPFGWQV